MAEYLKSQRTMSQADVDDAARAHDVNDLTPEERSSWKDN